MNTRQRERPEGCNRLGAQNLRGGCPNNNTDLVLHPPRECKEEGQRKSHMKEVHDAALLQSVHQNPV